MPPIPPLPDRRFALLKVRVISDLSGTYLRVLVPGKQAFDFLPAHRITPDAMQRIWQQADSHGGERKTSLTSSQADGESDVLAKIAEMPEPDRTMATWLHAIVKASAPALTPRTWYGMPAYAKDGKVVCFFQSAAKFKTRYATLGFSDAANLDEGALWPTAFALKELTPTEEARITALVKKAVS
jgi:uncharacterized protein YdhG (YjbR/CyaY superfamily)